MRIQVAAGAFQRRQGLAGLRMARRDGGQGAVGAGQQLVVIEGMQGLAQLEGDVVGDVDDVVDGSLTHQAQALL